MEPMSLRRRAPKLLGVDEYSAVVERPVDSIEQRSLLLVAQMMYRQRRNHRIVLLLDLIDTVVGDLEAESFARQFETRARPLEHLVRDIYHRDSRVREAVRDERRHQAGAGAKIENLERAFARKPDQIDRRPIEVVEAGHQATPRAVVILRRKIERVLY